jgi:hypothetical protein
MTDLSQNIVDHIMPAGFKVGLVMGGDRDFFEAGRLRQLFETSRRKMEQVSRQLKSVPVRDAAESMFGIIV